MSALKSKKPSAPARGQLGQQSHCDASAEHHYSSLNANEQKRCQVTNQDFIAHAFLGLAKDEVPWVTGFGGDPGDIEHALWGGRSATPLPWFIRPDHNNYIAISSFRQAADGRAHRSKDCFAAMHLVMVDDVGTKVPFGKVALPPSCLVETSPGNYQAWHFLAQPERNRLRAERLLNGMISSGLTADGSDPGMNGVTRYGRLPVGINGKAKYGGKFVQTVRIWTPETVFTVDQIAEAYGVDTTLPPPRSKGRRYNGRNPIAGGSADRYLDLLSDAGRYLEPARRTGGFHRILCPWVHEHTDQEPSGTAYFEPSEENAWQGGFKCHHGHCQGRTIADLDHFIRQLLRLKQGDK